MVKSDSAAVRRRKGIVIALGLVVLILVGGFYWLRQGSERAQAQRAPNRAVPVTVVAAARQDVPIYLTGLGTVQATFTVGIHSQVDGKLDQVLFTEGQHVKKGDLLAKIDPRFFEAALSSAKAKQAQDAANLVSYEKDMVRLKELMAKNYSTQQAIDQQQAKVDSTKAAIQADKAAIDSAQTQLDYASITAPSDGRMGMRLIDPGNVVHAGDQANIAMLTLTQPIAVVFTLPERTLDDVREAMARGAVQVIAYDRDNKKALGTGTLQTIDNMIDQTTGTYRLKASFANEDERLWPGEFVNARLQVATAANAIVIPNAAVQRGPDGLFTWVITSKNIAEPHPIETGPAAGAITIVTSGLNEGDKVVTDGQYKLQTGALVTITTTAPGPAGSS
ncbi:MAG TPA: efflux RND transporter periplasmic adaptor subunit [Alphaproteobacteria bacterium]|nr:efflux RND transporter periplasmic adaptor subunit [Alphaproteobacteria bacterium]